MAMKIGTKIKALRKAKNISQESLANVLGVTFQAVSKWETGTTAPDVSLIPTLIKPHCVSGSPMVCWMFSAMRVGSYLKFPATSGLIDKNNFC